MIKKYLILTLMLTILLTLPFPVFAQTKQGITPIPRPVDLGPPKVLSFKINNGAATTTRKTVTLNNVTERATLFCASERPDLQGAYWKRMHSAPQFTLSSGNGAKTVYFQVADPKGRKSAIISDVITLIPPIPEITLFRITRYSLPERPEDRNCPAGYCWEIRTENTATNSPTHYRFSEMADLQGSTWKPYKTNPTFYAKRRGIGRRLIYFQLKNQHGVSEPLYRSFSVRNRKDFRINGAKAKKWAEQRGFKFTVIGNHPLAVCELKVLGSSISMRIPYNAVYGSKCSYSLFYGKSLHEGWIFKSDFLQDCYNEVLKEPTVGSKDVGYQIDLEAQRAGSAFCGINFLTLEGPGDRLPWEAF